jgi:hypothetical protein
MAFEVDDVEPEVAELKRRGVWFEEVDLRGLRTIDGIADIEDDYPSKGRGEPWCVLTSCRRAFSASPSNPDTLVTPTVRYAGTT